MLLTKLRLRLSLFRSFLVPHFFTFKEIDGFFKDKGLGA
jgi:hypothetical protein